MSETPESPAPRTDKPVPRPPAANPYTPGRLFGIALLGAGCSLAAYYLFQQMEPEQRRSLRGSALRSVRGRLQGWLGEDRSGDEPG